MNATAEKLFETFSPSGLTGPIFDKELRVASRRKRTYLLRSAYILLLMLLIAVSWLSTITFNNTGSTILQTSRMAQVGRTIIMTMTWFQFVTAQLLAVIMLSNAISSEIHHKTLDVLMTTPITCFQIVAGKLASAMLQLLLLLSISFTVLGIVRVYGGIQWDYVLSTFCVTITGCIFCGSLSLFFSIKAKQAYSVIVTVLILYTASMGLFGLSSVAGVSDIAALLNPFAAFYMLQLKAMPRMAAAGATNFHWPLHCLMMLVVSCVIIAVSTVMVRKNALRQLAPATAKNKGKTKIYKRSASALEMKYMVGSPVIDDGLGISKLPMILKYLGFAVLAITVIMSGLSSTFNTLFFSHSFVSMGLWLIATIRTGSMAAASIAKEKESRSLAILLTTPLTSRQIIKAKSKAAIRRNISLWSFIILGNLVFYIGIMFSDFSGRPGEFTWIIIQLISLLFHVPAYIFFITASGLYFGAKLKNQSTAVIGFVIFALGTSIMYPFLANIFAAFFMSVLANSGSAFGGIAFSLVNSGTPIVMYVATAIILKRKNNQKPEKKHILEIIRVNP